MRGAVRRVSGWLARRLPLYDYLFGEFRAMGRRLFDLDRRMRLVQEALGRIEARQVAGTRGGRLSDREFRVYSQWGEDGIVSWLTTRVAIPRPYFVEIGVEDYEEANTRFLLMDRFWRGLLVEADAERVRKFEESHVRWLYDVDAVAAFVTRENVNDLLRANGAEGPIGLLSIDVDGMDWWIWDAIDVVDPAIVVVEYNHLFGDEDAVTVPYDPTFDRRSAHPSLLYYGASLPALTRLGDRKGYDLVGCTRAGLNAFFVKKDLRPDDLPALTAKEGFVDGSFSETHDGDGRRIDVPKAEQRRIVRSLPLVEVES